jgi:hypothetical protein
MSCRRRPLIWPLLIALCACARDASPATDPLKQLSPEATLADIAAFRRAAEEGHAALYRYRSKPEVQAKFAELEGAGRNGLTPIELWRHLSEFSAFVADAHLQVHPSPALYDRIYAQNLLPVSIAFRSGRCEVVESVTNEVPRGAPIVAVGGYRCDEIPQTFGRLIPADGRTTARKRYVLERDFPVLLAMLGGLERKIPVEFRSGPEAPLTKVALNTISIDTKQRLRGNSPAAASRSPFDHSLTFSDGDTALLQVRSFEKTRENRLPGFLEDSFAELRKRGTKNLIVDLRSNSGGRDEYAALLYSHIAAGPFRYAQARVANAKSFAFLKQTDDRWLNLMIRFVRKKQRADGKWVIDEKIDREQQPQKHSFKGRVVLLSDASAFSTSSEFASIFRSNGRGLIVGEESGNAYGGDSGATVTLPLRNSGLEVNIPLVEYHLAVRPVQPLDVGVLPDCVVERRFTDRFNGDDSMMPEALHVARTGECSGGGPVADRSEEQKGAGIRSE